ncbi:beta-lactamase family protein [Xylella fastidiosa subsp. morus]|jgi:beta-lactamase class C|uniref:Beta-lactamase family protein n=1 Tax=Xylella fastidiosa subsp. fastidiosa TaxID=644356 RepID=A0AAJ5QY36_XYLFS|nr:serine hydrolase domain-containing protein [Xylella fastidiosa]KAF0570698.1 beta-lactamase [Xylella fastidiosa subsp. fastidiosa Mus-1]AIC12488.1 beta-lactamase [Xylella fastidiosa MUL0034]EGO83016.1 Beta-lactamase class C and other penicillin binding protein [Xylella fastidiosa EB92.1]EWG14019.1 beta-lactamase [Xylella fastidiosa Mul-MD]KGM19879.1 beta-lactamase [Xylella fastidiosa]
MKQQGWHRNLRLIVTGLLGSLMPFTLSSTDQTPVLKPQSLPLITSSDDTQDKVALLTHRFDIKAIESMAEQLTYGQKVPGLAMAIVQGGHILSMRGYGVNDVSNPQPVNAHTVFRLASLSKAFASAMTGLLVNDGILSWNSKIVDYVPGFHLSNPTATNKLTVADVLSHRVGLSRNAYDGEIESNADYYSLNRKLAYAPLICSPGECYSYQNVAFSLIGDVVFAASGDFYEQAVERRIFKPLGMNDASLGLAGIRSSQSWARPHTRTKKGWRPVVVKQTYYHLAPAAGVNASASDMAQWLLAQTGHKPEVLPAPLLVTLHTPLVSTPSEVRPGWREQRLLAASYALGWRLFNYNGHTLVFHAGAVQGYRGLVALLPERDFGVAILCNGETGLPSGLLLTILDRVLGLRGQHRLDLETDSDFSSENMLAKKSTNESNSQSSLENKPSPPSPSTQLH